MCGISCASYLQKNGFGVTVFEKSRGIGGRMASRRINEQVSVDHGAQYIKPYSKNFLHFLEETVRAGFASSWSPLGMAKNYIQEKKIFVGTPRMNSILKNSSNNLEINFSSKINKILSNFKHMLSFTNIFIQDNYFKKMFRIYFVVVFLFFCKASFNIFGLFTILFLVIKNRYIFNHTPFPIFKSKSIVT